MPKTRKSMRKSRSRSNSAKKMIKKMVPVVKNVGKTTLKLAKQAQPVVEKGVGVVYNTMAKGFDMGLRGAKQLVNSKTKRRKHRK